LVRRWYPEANARRPWKPNSHRALDDIKESVAELQHYQQVVFRSPEEVSDVLKKNSQS